MFKFLFGVLVGIGLSAATEYYILASDQEQAAYRGMIRDTMPFLVDYVPE